MSFPPACITYNFKLINILYAGESGNPENFLGVNIGGKLKQKGTASWSTSNTGATNESHFTALPGGHFNFEERFDGLRYNGVWSFINLYESGDWEQLNYVIQTWLHYNNDTLDFDFSGSPDNLCSVRCI